MPLCWYRLQYPLHTNFLFFHNVFSNFLWFSEVFSTFLKFFNFSQLYSTLFNLYPQIFTICLNFLLLSRTFHRFFKSFSVPFNFSKLFQAFLKVSLPEYLAHGYFSFKSVKMQNLHSVYVFFLLAYSLTHSSNALLHWLFNRAFQGFYVGKLGPRQSGPGQLGRFNRASFQDTLWQNLTNSLLWLFKVHFNTLLEFQKI